MAKDDDKLLMEIQEKIENQTATLDDFYKKEAILATAKNECAKRNGGTGVCWYCGGRLCWGSDFNYDEVFGEGEGIATTMNCLDCGADALFSRRDGGE